MAKMLIFLRSPILIKDLYRLFVGLCHQSLEKVGVSTGSFKDDFIVRRFVNQQTLLDLQCFNATTRETTIVVSLVPFFKHSISGSFWESTNLLLTSASGAACSRSQKATVRLSSLLSS